MALKGRTATAEAILKRRFSRTEGKTPAFVEGEVQKLVGAIETSAHTGLRDRALLGTLAYTFARIGDGLPALRSSPLPILLHYQCNQWPEEVSYLGHQLFDLSQYRRDLFSGRDWLHRWLFDFSWFSVKWKIGASQLASRSND